MKAIIFDFNRTLYDPERKVLEDNALDLLEYFQTINIPLFILGKGNEERKKLIQSLGIERFFKEIIIKEEKTLDDMKYFKLKYPTYDFYVIGDRVRKEIKQGNFCGFKTIWFKKGKFASDLPQDADENPWKTIDSLNGVGKILLTSR